MGVNYYDQIEIDVERCHHLIDEGLVMNPAIFYNVGFLEQVSRKFDCYERMVDSGLIRGWFEEFSDFWIKVLRGRPLKLHDFFYLYCHYRTKFQAIEIDETRDPSLFLKAWQQYENVFLLFSSTYKYALSPFGYRSFRSFLGKRKKILEYGCGFAPIVTSMVRAHLTGYDYTVADIRTLNFAFAKYRLHPHGVHSVDLEPLQRANFETSFDSIFLMTVIEHLPNPLDVVKELTEALEPGGYLVFDYVLSEGKGLDTLAAIEQRTEVLDFLRHHYDLVQGALKENASMGTTVVRKIG